VKVSAHSSSLRWGDDEFIIYQAALVMAGGIGAAIWGSTEYHEYTSRPYGEPVDLAIGHASHLEVHHPCRFQADGPIHAERAHSAGTTGLEGASVAQQRRHDRARAAHREPLPDAERAGGHRQDSSRKIDRAVAAVLAHEAAMTMPEAAAPAVPLVAWR
jgi:hypothetical protein